MTAKQSARPAPGLNRWRLLVAGAVLIAGALGTWGRVWITDREMREELLAQAHRTAQGLDLARIRALTGTVADLDSHHYQRLKEDLTLIRQANDDCRFVYLMGRRDGDTVFLFADSESPDSEDYSPPGQIYTEAGQAETGVFVTGKPVVDGPRLDRWGIWVTAYVPIADPWSGTVLAILGMDIDARVWNRDLLRAAWLPVLLTLVLAAVFVAGSVLLARRRRSAGQGHAWLRYIEPALTLVAGLVVTLFVARTACDREAHHRITTFAQLADSGTDRMAAIIHALRDFELETLARFLEASDDVANDGFRQFTEPLTRNPAVFAWQWLPAVPAADKANFEQQALAEGLRDFRIWERDAAGKRIAANGREEFYPVFRGMPRAANEAVLGYDSGSEAIRRAALEQAARTGLMTGTAPITLVQETGNQKGMVIFRPVFERDHPDSLRGFAVAVLRMESLLACVHDHGSVHLDLALLRKDEAPELLASSCDSLCAESPGYHVARPVSAFGKVFLVTAHAGPEFFSRFPARAGALTALAGTLVAALLTVLTAVPIQRREELQRLIEARTAEWVASEARYVQIAEQSRTFTWEVDMDGLYTYVSHVVEQVLGYRPEELIGKIYFYDLCPEAEREAIKARAFDTIERREKFVDVENPMLSKDGQVVWVSSAGLPLRNADGTVRGYRGADADITERKRNEAERERLLTEAEQSRQSLLSVLEDHRQAEAHRIRLATAIEQAGEVVVITDPQGAIQYVNPAFENVSGYTREEVLGLNSRILKSGTQDQAFYRELWETISGGRIWHGRFVNKRKDGTLYIEDATISPVRSAEGRIVNYVAVKRDVTEHLRVRDENVSLEEQVRQAQKVESIGRLAGGVAHDFNNMLSVILGYGEHLLEQLASDDPLRKDVQQIVEAGQRSAVLTRQLLAFSRRQTLEPEVLDLNTIVEKLETVLRRLIGEHLELELTLAEDLNRVLVDPGQIEHVIINLAINARDAMAGGGKLAIETANIEFDEASARGRFGIEPGKYALLTVADSGCGMNQDTLDHMFEPFFTTKEEGRGTGLGLCTALGIVQQSGGHIEAESEPGKGTTVKVYLPQTLAEPTVKKRPAVQEERHRDRKHVLVAEDEAALRSLIQRGLSGLGYQVSAAANGEEALRLVEEQGLRPDLLVTDVVMPVMSGSSLAEQLRRDQPDLQVLYMSGYAEEAIVHHGILSPGTHFIPKPFSTRNLAAKVREVLGVPPARSQRRILMIDDEALFRDLVQHFCRKRGHDFVGVGTGAAALEALADQFFDVVVVDMNLAGTDGETVLRQIRAAGHTAPAIVLTGDLFSVDRATLDPLGVINALEKSSDSTPLMLIIEQL